MSPIRPSIRPLTALALGLVALAAAGCEKTVEQERRDVQEARAEAAEAERSAPERKAEIEREAAEKKAAVDRDVEEQKADVAEEQREARRAEAGDPMTADEKLRERFDDFDKRLIEMREEARKLEGPARVDADRTIDDLERRRARLRDDVSTLGTRAEEGVDKAGAKIESGLEELSRELDEALRKARASVRTM